MRLSELQRYHVVDESGARVGHLFDLATEEGARGEPPVVRTLLVGRGGLAKRLGIGRGRASEVRVHDVIALREGSVVVRRRPSH